MSQLRIELPNACHQAFDAMPRTEGGRYCALCERTIIDFTNMSDDEFIEYLTSHQFKISCGIFRHDQLNRDFAFQKTRPFFRFPTLNKWVAAFFLLPLSLPQGFAQTKQANTQQLATKTNSNTPIQLNGKLVANDSINGIADIEIQLLDSNHLVLQTILTDQNGKFNFHIPAERMHDTVHLRAQTAPNFYVEPISLSLSFVVSHNPPIILTMMPMVNLPAVNVITNLPQRFETHTAGAPLIRYSEEIKFSTPDTSNVILSKLFIPRKKKSHRKK